MPSAARTLWAFVTSIIEVALVTPIREGTLHLRDHSPAAAGITWVVSGVIGALIVGMAAANPLRSVTDFVATVDLSGSNVVPAILVPGTLFLLAVAIALVLAGTQRLRVWLRILLLVACLAILSDLIASSGTVDASSLWISWTLLAGLIGYCVLIWTGRTRVGVDFVVLFVLTVAITATSYRRFVAGTQSIDIRFDLMTTSTLLIALTSLAMPIAFTSGLAATKFGASILDEVASFAARRLRPVTASLLLVVIIAQQVVVVTPGLLARWSGLGLVNAAGATAGGALTIGLCVAVWRLVHRWGGGGQVAEKDVSHIASSAALPVAYALIAPLIISNLLGLIGSALTLGGSDAAQATVLRLVQASGGDTAVTVARVATVVGLIGAGSWMISRHRPRAAAVLLIDAIMLSSVLLAVPFLRAAHIAWTVTDLATIGLALGFALLCWWLVRRSLTAVRLLFLYTLVLLSALMRQADYFEVPVEFVIGGSTIAVLVVGLVWGFLTDGGETHEDHPRSPRDGKLLFFLGRFLFSITIAAWAVIGKQVDLAGQLAKTTQLAVLTVGTGYLVAIVLETASRGRAVEQAPRT